MRMVGADIRRRELRVCQYRKHKGKKNDTQRSHTGHPNEKLSGRNLKRAILKNNRNDNGPSRKFPNETTNNSKGSPSGRARRNSRIEIMPKRQQRMPQQHPWPRKTHDLLHPRAHLWRVAVHVAIRTGRFLFVEGTFQEALVRILEQLEAFRTHGIGAAVQGMTIDFNHCRNGLLLPPDTSAPRGAALLLVHFFSPPPRI